MLVTAVCIDTMSLKDPNAEVLGQPCHGLGGNQVSINNVSYICMFKRNPK